MNDMPEEEIHFLGGENYTLTSLTDRRDAVDELIEAVEDLDLPIAKGVEVAFKILAIREARNG